MTHLSVHRASGSDGATKHRLEWSQVGLAWGDVIRLWENDPAFADEFSALLNSCGLDAYVWETPPLSLVTLDREFEFVLKRKAGPARFDQETYREQFELPADEGIVAFDNLGRDAVLVVPVPPDPQTDYRDLASFLRNAPSLQQRALWRVVGRQARVLTGTEPVWISVAGGGVSWLHVRLDSQPKYYRHAEYRQPLRQD